MAYNYEARLRVFTGNLALSLGQIYIFELKPYTGKHNDPSSSCEENEMKGVILFYRFSIMSISIDSFHDHDIMLENFLRISDKSRKLFSWVG